MVISSSLIPSSSMVPAATTIYFSTSSILFSASYSPPDLLLVSRSTNATASISLTITGSGNYTGLTGSFGARLQVVVEQEEVGTALEYYYVYGGAESQITNLSSNPIPGNFPYTLSSSLFSFINPATPTKLEIRNPSSGVTAEISNISFVEIFSYSSSISSSLVPSS